MVGADGLKRIGNVSPKGSEVSTFLRKITKTSIFFFFRITYTDELCTIRPGKCIKGVNRANSMLIFSTAVCLWTLQEV